jgi:hypothetical protein
MNAPRVARAHLARWVVVELHPHEVEEPRADRAAVPLVRERALRRRAQDHPLAALVPAHVLQIPGEAVPVLAAAELDVEVDAVKDGVAEGPGRRRRAAEVAVPEVRGHVARVPLGGQAVAAVAAADGEQDLDAAALARTYICPRSAPCSRPTRDRSGWQGPAAASAPCRTCTRTRG